MRDINQMTITDAVKASFKDRSNARLMVLIDKLIEHLHDFARETNLTHEEWMAALTFLYDAGKISTPDRQEYILLSDVLGFSALVDMINTRGGGTEGSNLGPFYLDDAPELPLGADLMGAREGVAILASGIVRNTLGHPIPGATIDTWQADGSGMYPIQDASQDKYALRGKFTTDDEGRYFYTTVMPKPYTVPYDGPVGRLLIAADRHAWRAKHLHYIIRAPKYRSITTEVFFDGDEYNDSDAVFGVRRSLIAKLERVPADAEIEVSLERRPDARVRFDFVLAPGD
jgi:hydroxyquinol 1,2-dioxygenase